MRPRPSSDTIAPNGVTRFCRGIATPDSSARDRAPTPRTAQGDAAALAPLGKPIGRPDYGKYGPCSIDVGFGSPGSLGLALATDGSVQSRISSGFPERIHLAVWRSTSISALGPRTAGRSPGTSPNRSGVLERPEIESINPKDRPHHSELFEREARAIRRSVSRTLPALANQPAPQTPCVLSRIVSTSTVISSWRRW